MMTFRSMDLRCSVVQYWEAYLGAGFALRIPQASTNLTFLPSLILEHRRVNYGTDCFRPIILYNA